MVIELGMENKESDDGIKKEMGLELGMVNELGNG